MFHFPKQVQITFNNNVNIYENNVQFFFKLKIDKLI